MVKLDDAYPLAKNFKDFGELFSVIIKNVFMLTGLLFFFVLIFSGLKYILSGGNKEQLQKASAGMTAGLIGLIIVFASFWIVQIIQTVTGIESIIK